MAQEKEKTQISIQCMKTEMKRTLLKHFFHRNTFGKEGL